MALELYMIGIVTQDMGKSLEFYRRLGLAIPDGSEGQIHVEVKMGSGLTFFLDSRPSRWDPGFNKKQDSGQMEAPDSYRFLLEFYLKSRATLEAKYKELTGYGYQDCRAPYKTSFGMYFAMVKDPDGNTILLSADLEE
jgi:catechol 2,3-dioxygenase-like lactoylglutathione lyase family enzyme